MIRIALAATAACLALAAPALAAPVNQPKPGDLTDAPPPPPKAKLEIGALKSGQASASRPGADRPEDLTDRPPSRPAVTLPTLLKDRWPTGATGTGEKGARSAVGRRHH